MSGRRSGKARPGDGSNGQQNSEQVYARLKHEILVGDLPSQQALVETTLAQRYNVSRTPVRQALLALERDGVVVRDGRSLRVRTQSNSEILELYEIREMLEEHAARLAAQRHDASDAIVLNHLIDRMSSETSRDERYDLNREFHSAICRAAHQSVLLQTIERLYANSVQSLSTTLNTPDRWTTTVTEHRAMVDAILARDGDRAALLVREHLRTARDIRIKASLTSLEQSRGGS